MNVLYISYDGMTDPLGQSQVIPYLTGLSRKGYRIFLISFEKPLPYQRYGGRIRESLRQSEIDWHPLPYIQSPPVISTLLNLRKAQNLTKKLIRRHSVSLLHCRSYLAALIGLRMKRKSGIPFIFDMRGFWADERVEGGLWNLRNPLYKGIFRYFKKKEKQFFAESAHIISLTQAGRHLITEMYPAEVPPQKITVIPCCADTSLFRPLLVDVTIRKLQAELNIDKNALVIAYLGSFGTWYMANEMFDFFQQFRERYPSALFLVVTKDNPEEIADLIRRKRMEKECVRLVAAERYEIPSLLALCRATLFFIRPTFSKKASSPTKMAESLCCGVPVICNDGIGDCTSIIRETGTGIIVEEFTEKAYGKAIEQFDSLLKLEPHIIRQKAKPFFDLNVGVERYSEIYQALSLSLNSERKNF